MKKIQEHSSWFPHRYLGQIAIFVATFIILTYESSLILTHAAQQHEESPVLEHATSQFWFYSYVSMIGTCEVTVTLLSFKKHKT